MTEARKKTTDVGARIEPFIAQLARQLVDELPTLVDDLCERIFDRDPFYAHVRETMGHEVRRSADEHLGQLIRGLAGMEPLDFDLPRELARTRAEQGVPIVALLNAYRLAAEVVWDHVVGAGQATGDADFEPQEVLHAAARLWELSNRYSTIISQAYDETMADRVRRSERERVRMLAALLDGAGPRGLALGDVAHYLGLPDRGTFVVVAAEVQATGGPGPTDLELRLRMTGTRSAWRVEDGLATGVVVVGGTGRVQVTGAGLRDRLRTVGLARAGVSPHFTELGAAPGQVALAEVARHCIGTDDRIVFHDDEPVATLVAAAPLAAARTADLVLGPLLALADDERNHLLGALEAWIDSGGSAARAAERLYCHRNTVRNRLARVEDLTGRSLSEPAGVTEVCVAMAALRLTGGA